MIRSILVLSLCLNIIFFSRTSYIWSWYTVVRSRAQSTEQIHRPVKDTSSQSLVFDKDGDLVITRQSGNYGKFILDLIKNSLHICLWEFLSQHGLLLWGTTGSNMSPCSSSSAYMIAEILCVSVVLLGIPYFLLF